MYDFFFSSGVSSSSGYLVTGYRTYTSNVYDTRKPYQLLNP